MDGWEHVSLKHWTSWRHTAGFVDADTDCMLGGRKSSVNWVVCFILVGGIGSAEGCFIDVMDSFQDTFDWGFLTVKGTPSLP